jgi:anaphase-promoting complex subunit 4
VAWDDLSTEIIAVETGKTVPQALQDPGLTDEPVSKNRRIACLAWDFKFIDVAKSKSKVDHSTNGTESKDDAELRDTTDVWDAEQEGIAVNDVLQGRHDLSVLDLIRDLPYQLARMDPGKWLPKLSALPAPPTGPLGRPVAVIPDIFVSQVSIDAMFHSGHLEFPNAVETLLLCHANGEVSPTMYTSLKVAAIKSPSEWQWNPKSRTLQASHEYSPSHCLLAEIASSSDPQRYRLCFVPLTYRFLTSPELALTAHTVTSKQQQLDNLLRYMQETLRCISAFWYHSQDLPSKFMRNINETLEEKGEGDLTTMLYHVAATGHCPNPVKEWLVDELTETVRKYNTIFQPI